MRDASGSIGMRDRLAWRSARRCDDIRGRCRPVEDPLGLSSGPRQHIAPSPGRPPAGETAARATCEHISHGAPLSQRSNAGKHRSWAATPVQQRQRLIIIACRFLSRPCGSVRFHRRQGKGFEVQLSLVSSASTPRGAASQVAEKSSTSPRAKGTVGPSISGCSMPPAGAGSMSC